MPTYDYDLIAIGSGPSGQYAAVQAAKVGRRVAVIERKLELGGVCINTGTIPSKSLREAVIYLSGLRERTLYGEGYSVKSGITVQDLLYRCHHVMQHEQEITKSKLLRNHVDLISGSASFISPHEIAVTDPYGRRVAQLSGEVIVIAVGTKPLRPAGIPFDGNRILDSDGILDLDHIPRSLAVVGAGVVGCEYASIFASLDVHVTLIDRRPAILDFVDREIVDALSYHLRNEANVSILLGDGVTGIASNEQGVHLTLDSEKRVVVEKVVYCAGRSGATDALGLENAGLTTDRKGSLKVDEHYQTEVPGIYATGDVVGFPSLASTSMEQGRVAACHAFQIPAADVSNHFPYGIYTIPGATRSA